MRMMVGVLQRSFMLLNLYSFSKTFSSKLVCFLILADLNEIRPILPQLLDGKVAHHSRLLSL